MIILLGNNSSVSLLCRSVMFLCKTFKLVFLCRYDAVSFLKFLDTLRVSESYRSVWLFAESSYKIFDFAKKRVYRLVKASDVKSKEHVKNKSGKKRNSKGETDSVEAGN